jgi:O-antigen ligase
VNRFDRIVVAAIAFMYAVIPLYGAFGILDPLRPPIPPLIGLGATIAIAVAALAAAAICACGALRRPAPKRLVLAQLVAGGFIIPSALLGFDPPTGLLLALIVMAVGTVGIAVYGYAALPGVVRAIVIATLASAALAVMLALVMVVTRRPAALYAYNNGRAVGTFLNPNELAAYLLVVIGLAAGVAFFGRGAATRAIAALALAVAAAGFAATYSRWAFISALAGLAAFALLARTRRSWAVLAVTVACAVFIVAGPGREHHNPRDDASRVVAWTTGWRTFLAFPLTGVGPLAFKRTYEVLRPPFAPGGDVPVAYDPHSLPLAYLDESGIVSLAGLIAIWCIYAGAIRAALRDAPERRRNLAYAFCAGLFALNVHVLVNTISLYFVFLTQGVALALALAQRGLDASAD